MPPSPPRPPSNLSQPHLTITVRDSIYSTMSLCTHGPFPWHALERDTHAHTHVHPRESERLEHALTVEKIKMALPSICGMTSAGGCGRGVKRSSSQGVGRYKGSLWDGCGRHRTHWRLGKQGGWRWS